MAAVTMRHPQSGRTQRASRAAFDSVWSQEGWVLVNESQPAVPKPTRRAAKKAAPKPADES